MGIYQVKDGYISSKAQEDNIYLFMLLTISSDFKTVSFSSFQDGKGGKTEKGKSPVVRFYTNNIF